MYTLDACCSLCGERFSPKVAEAKIGLVFSKKNEPLEIGTRGRYRDLPIPYGSASLEAPPSSTPGSNLNALLELLEKHLSTIKDCGAEDVILHCNVFHDGQCNLEFSAEQIVRAARLGLPITVSCYEDTVRFSERVS